MPILDVFQTWPEDGYELPIDKVVELYNNKFRGCEYDPEAREQLRQEIMESGGIVNGADATQQYGYSGAHAGKLVVPYVYVAEQLPGCWPGAAQARGDCVSHNEKNACLLTYGCEVYAAKPDEVTGKLEVMPEIAPVAIKQGAFSTEVFYWYRGHGGDGWSCAASARVSMRNAGLVVRQPYPDLDFDLTKYSGSLAGKWGRSAPPSEVGRELALHLIRTVTEVDNPNTCRDLLGEGYGIGTCGGEGWSDTRDQYGFSKRSGSWSHAMAFLAFDDRPDTVSIYGSPWVLIQNSWGKFNGGPRDIRDSAQYVPPEKKQDWIAKGLVNPQTGNLMIPEGSFWAKWSDVKNRDMYAHSGTNGWPARNLNPFHVPGVFV